MSELGTIAFGLAIIGAAVGGAAVLTWFERRLLGIWQDRYGPNRLGPLGAFQVLADMLKLLTKDDWVPPFADRAPTFCSTASIKPSQTRHDCGVRRKRARLTSSRAAGTSTSHSAVRTALVSSLYVQPESLS